jgi:hypothetical protein
MDVCVRSYSVFVSSCVYVTALRQPDNSSKESYRLCKNDYGTEEKASAQQRAVEPLMNESTKHLLQFCHVGFRGNPESWPRL